MSSQSVQLTLRVSGELDKKLRKLAEKERRKLADYMRIVLEDHVAKKRL